MTNIQTLIADIYSLVSYKEADHGQENLWTRLERHSQTRSLDEEGLHKKLQLDPVRLLSNTQDKRNKTTDRPTLRLSQMGPRCPRHLWFSIHNPELAEPMPPWAQIKFAFGDILEALCINLAKVSGHEVTGEQDEITVDGIVGHRDCVIDGCVVDIKSASSRAFIKFKDKSIAKDDAFGYLDQLDGYVVGSSNDPLVRVKDKGYLLAIDKQLGHMALYEHNIRENHIRSRIREYKRIVESDNPPDCNCSTKEFGKSGNIGLDVKASYSPFKFCCFPKLRTFLYSDGPVYLTKVVREPDVPEIDRHGKLIRSTSYSDSQRSLHFESSD